MQIFLSHRLSLQVLFLSHPRKDIRDTAQYKLFRELVHSGRPSLKKLTAQLLGVEVQQGEHNSVSFYRHSTEVIFVYLMPSTTFVL